MSAGTLESLLLDTWAATRLRLSGRSSAPVTAPPSGAYGLFIGMANSAGQAWAWARAAEGAMPGCAATSMMNLRGSPFRFRVDQTVDPAYAARSRVWQRRQFRSLRRFEGVLVESAGGPLGGRFGGDAAKQIRALLSAGVQVGLIFHGSDVRDPDWHMSVEPRSHYADDRAYAEHFRQVSRRSRQLIEDTGLPVFVSTLGMLDEVPGATWLPVVVEPSLWERTEPPFALSDSELSDRPLRVVHVPSDSHIKGTPLIAGVLEELSARGVIEYRAAAGVPHAKMPDVYGEADVVLDSFRAGGYGVAACEAMASGRLVVAHIAPRTRDRVPRYTGEHLPIVEATVDTLGEVLTDISRRRSHYGEIAAQGPGFVHRNHDGTRSGETLASWLRPGGDPTGQSKERCCA